MFPTLDAHVHLDPPHSQDELSASGAVLAMSLSLDMAERTLAESDHGLNDLPAAIPCRLEWAEYLAAQQYDMDVKELRQLVLKNLARVLHETNTTHLFPGPFTKLLPQSVL